ncbi:MAG: DUF1273 domain-containing protein [Rikenellaceae bacterium]|nr:DUF1273 domain-containing protein [Rikenellaceae bacterium]MCL2692764.1 DUF1273 domain-containing protein [Rikenellaceae bacterium]
MEREKSRTAAFSGHRTFKMGRTLFGAAGACDGDMAVRLCETLTALAEEGYTDFLCGMAEGFDLLAAEAVVAVRRDYPAVRLTAVVPFPEQARAFGVQTRERYEDLLAAADSVEVISPRYTADCFHRRNDWLVAHASVLICYYNGSRGGTQYTVRRALAGGLRIINLE